MIRPVIFLLLLSLAGQTAASCFNLFAGEGKYNYWPGDTTGTFTPTNQFVSDNNAGTTDPEVGKYRAPFGYEFRDGNGNAFPGDTQPTELIAYCNGNQEWRRAPFSEANPEGIDYANDTNTIAITSEIQLLPRPGYCDPTIDAQSTVLGFGGGTVTGSIDEVAELQCADGWGSSVDENPDDYSLTCAPCDPRTNACPTGSAGRADGAGVWQWTRDIPAVGTPLDAYRLSAELNLDAGDLRSGVCELRTSYCPYALPSLEQPSVDALDASGAAGFFYADPPTLPAFKDTNGVQTWPNGGPDPVDFCPCRDQSECNSCTYTGVTPANMPTTFAIGQVAHLECEEGFQTTDGNGVRVIGQQVTCAVDSDPNTQRGGAWVDSNGAAVQCVPVTFGNGGSDSGYCPTSTVPEGQSSASVTANPVPAVSGTANALCVAGWSLDERDYTEQLGQLYCTGRNTIYNAASGVDVLVPWPGAAPDQDGSGRGEGGRWFYNRDQQLEVATCRAITHFCPNLDGSGGAPDYRMKATPFRTNFVCNDFPTACDGNADLVPIVGAGLTDTSAATAAADCCQEVTCGDAGWSVASCSAVSDAAETANTAAVCPGGVCSYGHCCSANGGRTDSVCQEHACSSGFMDWAAQSTACGTTCSDAQCCTDWDDCGSFTCGAEYGYGSGTRPATPPFDPRGIACNEIWGCSGDTCCETDWVTGEGFFGNQDLVMVDCIEGHALPDTDGVLSTDTRGSFTCAPDDQAQVFPGETGRYGLLHAGAPNDDSYQPVGSDPTNNQWMQNFVPSCEEIPDFCSAETATAGTTEVTVAAGVAHDIVAYGDDWSCAAGYAPEDLRTADSADYHLVCREDVSPTQDVAAPGAQGSGVWSEDPNADGAGTTDADGWAEFACTQITHYCCFDDNGVCNDGEGSDPDANAEFTAAANPVTFVARDVTVTKLCDDGFGRAAGTATAFNALSNPALYTEDQVCNDGDPNTNGLSGQVGSTDFEDCEVMQNYCCDPASDCGGGQGTKPNGYDYDPETTTDAYNAVNDVSSPVTGDFRDGTEYEVVCGPGRAIDPNATHPTPVANHQFMIECAQATGQRYGEWQIAGVKEDAGCEEIPVYCEQPANTRNGLDAGGVWTDAGQRVLSATAVAAECLEGYSHGGQVGETSRADATCMAGTDFNTKNYRLAPDGTTHLLGQWKWQTVNNNEEVVNCLPTQDLCGELVVGALDGSQRSVIPAASPTALPNGYEDGSTSTITCPPGMIVGQSDGRGYNTPAQSRVLNVECSARVDGGVIVGEWKLTDDSIDGAGLSPASTGVTLTCVPDETFCIDDVAATQDNRADRANSDRYLETDSVPCDNGYAQAGTEEAGGTPVNTLALDCAQVLDDVTVPGDVQGRWECDLCTDPHADWCQAIEDYCTDLPTGASRQFDYYDSFTDNNNLRGALDGVGAITDTNVLVCDDGYSLDGQPVTSAADMSAVVTCSDTPPATSTTGVWEAGTVVAVDECLAFETCTTTDLASGTNVDIAATLGGGVVGTEAIVVCAEGSHVYNDDAEAGFWRSSPPGDVQQIARFDCEWDDYTFNSGAIDGFSFVWRAPNFGGDLDLGLRPVGQAMTGADICLASNDWCPRSNLPKDQGVIFRTHIAVNGIVENFAISDTYIFTEELTNAAIDPDLDTGNYNYLAANYITCDKGYEMVNTADNSALGKTHTEVQCDNFPSFGPNTIGPLAPHPQLQMDTVTGRWTDVTSGNPTNIRCDVLDGYCVADGTAGVGGFVEDGNVPAGQIDDTGRYCCLQGYARSDVAASTEYNIPVVCSGDPNTDAKVLSTNVGPWLTTADAQGGAGATPECAAIVDFCALPQNVVAFSPTPTDFQLDQSTPPNPQTISCAAGHSLDAGTYTRSGEFVCEARTNSNGDTATDGCDTTPSLVATDFLEGDLTATNANPTLGVATCTEWPAWCNLNNFFAANPRNARRVDVRDGGGALLYSTDTTTCTATAGCDDARTDFPVGAEIDIVCEPGYHISEDVWNAQFQCLAGNTPDVAGSGVWESEGQPACIEDPSYCSDDRAALLTTTTPNHLTFDLTGDEIRDTATITCGTDGYTFGGVPVAQNPPGETDLGVVCRVGLDNERVGVWEEQACDRETELCQILQCQAQTNVCPSGDSVRSARGVPGDVVACGQTNYNEAAECALDTTAVAAGTQDTYGTLVCDAGYEVADQDYNAAVRCIWSGQVGDLGFWRVGADAGPTISESGCSATPDYCLAVGGADGAPSDGGADRTIGNNGLSYDCAPGYAIEAAGGLTSQPITCTAPQADAYGEDAGVFRFVNHPAEPVQCDLIDNLCPDSINDGAFVNEPNPLPVDSPLRTVTGGSVSFDCRDGFEARVNGAFTSDPFDIECNADGVWRDTSAAPAAVSCSRVRGYCPADQNGLILTASGQDDRELDDGNSYSCQVWQTLDTDAAIQCFADDAAQGEWRAGSAVAGCTDDPNFCSTPLNNGETDVSLAGAGAFGQPLVFVCIGGYTQGGNLGDETGEGVNYECDINSEHSENGAGVNVAQSCSAVQDFCTIPANAEVDSFVIRAPGDNIVDAEADGACVPGSSVDGLRGSATDSGTDGLTCTFVATGQPGEWQLVSGGEFACVAIADYCDFTGAQDLFGSLSPAVNPLDAQPTYTCDVGSLLGGTGGGVSVTVECQADNSYTLVGGAALDNCAVADDWCAVADLDFTQGSNTFTASGQLDSMATFGCAAGYELPLGFPTTSICQAGRTWSQAAPGACIDVPECDSADTCPDNNACEELPGNYTCIPCDPVTEQPNGAVCECRSGFEDDGNGTCVDVNECLDLSVGGLNACNPKSDCVNIDKALEGVSFTCCPETTADANGDRQADSSGNCICPTLTEPTTSGSTGCQDTDECLAEPCGQGEECTNIDCVATTCADGVGYTCGCAPGFADDGMGVNGTINCVPVDECATGTDDCASGEICTDLLPAEGRFICCGQNSAAAQRADDDSWECACAAGYAKVDAADNFCNDFNECTGEVVGARRRRRQVNGTVSDMDMATASQDGGAAGGTAASHQNSSAAGTMMASMTEHSSSPTPSPTTTTTGGPAHDCTATQNCGNTDGSFTCTDCGALGAECCASGAACPATAACDAATNMCVDVDECADGTDNCAADELCTNTDTGFTCTACGGDGQACCASDTCDTGFSCVMSACQADAVSSSSGAPSPPGPPADDNAGGKGKGNGSSAALLQLSSALLAFLL